jgi:hypothetical protein
LDAIWRPDPAFIGPVEPPMVRWIRIGSPKSAWELKALARHDAHT